MRYRLRDLPALARTPIGRARIAEGLHLRSWPLAQRLASLHRRTLARSTHVVAVVGSLGKTTTRRAVAAALGLPPESHHRNALTYAARAILAIRSGQARAVIEIGISDKRQMRPYASMLRPDIAVVTSIGSEHHRSLGTLEVTRDEKAWMVRALGPGGVAVLNGDDPNVMWMAGETDARVVTYGFGAGCDVRAEGERLDWPQGMRFRLTGFGESRDVSLRLIGRHMVYPALAAFAVSRLEGIPPDEALARVSALEPTQGRMQPVPLPGGATLLRDEFKSTTETIDTALDALAAIPGRRLVVLGNVSEPVGPQRAAYRRIGERVGAIAARVIIVGSTADEMYRGALQRAGLSADRILVAGKSPRRAAELLASAIEPGDVVLIKGRDTQKLDRVRLILAGRDVRCDIDFCDVRTLSCATCPMLERGWTGDERP